MLELLAENNFGDTRSGGLAGPTGLVIVLLLVVGTVLLIRNMNARLRRLPRSFDEPNSPAPVSPAPVSPGAPGADRGPEPTDPGPDREP